MMGVFVANSFGILPDGFNPFGMIILIKFWHKLDIIRHKKEAGTKYMSCQHIHYSGLAIRYLSAARRDFIKVKADNLRIAQIKLCGLLQNWICVYRIKQRLAHIIPQYGGI